MLMLLIWTVGGGWWRPASLAGDWRCLVRLSQSHQILPSLHTTGHRRGKLRRPLSFVRESTNELNAFCVPVITSR